MLDLDPSQLNEVQDILRHYVPGCEVRAYGSRVRGRAWRFSDLDLTVVGEGPLPLEKTRILRDAFSISDLPILVDVSDWHRIPDSFKKVIEEQYEVIQEAQE